MAENKPIPLEFEKPLDVLSEQIDRLEQQLVSHPELEEDIDKLQEQYSKLKKSLYSNLKSIDHLAIARHPQRPYTRDYLERWDRNWLELQGDRKGTDDPAMVSGLVCFDDSCRAIVIGTQKGRDIRSKQRCNFGMPQPEGYRKALRLFRHAEKFGIPIVTLIDTPGAYPGLEAEAHNQAQAIAVNLLELSGLSVPVVSVVTGEGGSGGALAIGVANRILMLEHSVYSVISPEGCASILWRSSENVLEAAEAMRITAKEIFQLGVIDEVIKEPLGGAHHDMDLAADRVKEALVKQLKELSKLSYSEIRADRQMKYRQMGAFTE